MERNDFVAGCMYTALHKVKHEESIDWCFHVAQPDIQGQKGHFGQSMSSHTSLCLRNRLEWCS